MITHPVFSFLSSKGNKKPLQDACMSVICSSLIPSPVCAGKKTISIAALVCIVSYHCSLVTDSFMHAKLDRALAMTGRHPGNLESVS